MTSNIDFHNHFHVYNIRYETKHIYFHYHFHDYIVFYDTYVTNIFFIASHQMMTFQHFILLTPMSYVYAHC